MKIRNGFVSNSSSTSFCICGYIYNNNEDIYDLEKMFHQENKNELKISIYSQDEGCPTYIGFDITCMEDEQTLKEFKQLCFDIMSKYDKSLNFEDIGLYSDSWYC